MITRKEQETHQIQIDQHVLKLKTAIQSLSPKNLSMLKTDLERFRGDVKSIESMMKEQIQRVYGNTVLDMNLEQGRYNNLL